MFTHFVIEHNVQIASTNHGDRLFWAVFPYSKIATNYGHVRTKTSAIIQSMAKLTQSEIVNDSKNHIFPQLPMVVMTMMIINCILSQHHILQVSSFLVGVCQNLYPISLKILTKYNKMDSGWFQISQKIYLGEKVYCTSKVNANCITHSTQQC